MPPDPDLHPDEALDASARVHVWTVLIPAAVGVLLAGVALGAMHLAWRGDRAPAPTAATPTATAAPIHCPIPAQAGDRQVITIERTGGQLLVRCLAVTNWRTPERNK